MEQAMFTTMLDEQQMTLGCEPPYHSYWPYQLCVIICKMGLEVPLFPCLM